MNLTADTINGSPVFVLASTQKEPWHRVYGATAAARPGAWVFPAYYPLGRWALRDLEILTRRAPLALDAGAKNLARELRDAHDAYTLAQTQYDARVAVDLPLPSGWKWHVFEPFAHQRLGIAIGLSWWRHLYLWEMGTGKTKTIVETLRLERARGGARRTLVLCPRIVVPTWQREVATWSDGELTSYHWQSSDEDRAARAAAADVVVVTYQTSRIEAENALAARANVRKDPTSSLRATWEAAAVDPLLELDYSHVYADESHMIASWESAQTRAALQRSVRAARRGCLSGTAADQPMKLYPQLRFLAPGLAPMDYQKFLDAHVVFHPEKRYLVRCYKGLAGLNERVNAIASRMQKTDCLDLPPRTFVDVPFALGLHQKARYNEVVRTMTVTTDPIRNLEITRDAPEVVSTVEADDRLTSAQLEVLMEMPHGAARLEKVLQVSSGFILKGPDRTICDACPKMGACVEARIKPYTRRCDVVQAPPPREVIRDFENPKRLVFEDLLDTILDADETNKVLCWANHTEELDDMEAVCVRRGWGHIRISGKTTHRIAEMEATFQTDKACRVSLGIVSAGVGITLTAANYTVYYALPWNRIHYRQSLDRNHRPGQNRKITVYRLLGTQTIEPIVANVLHKKELIASTLTDRIDCTVCPHALRCAKASIKPFGEGCVYQPQIERPVVKVTEVT